MTETKSTLEKTHSTPALFIISCNIKTSSFTTQIEREMADVAVGYLLENLQQLLFYKDDLIVDVKVQVDALKKNLVLFKAFIRDSTEQRSDSQLVLETVNNIRSVVHKAEDAIDKFVVEKAKYKDKRLFSKAFRAVDHSKAIRDVVKKIELLIRTEVKDIHDQKLLAKAPDKGPTEKKPPAVEEDNVVGFDEVADTLIKRLNDGENSDLDIITIVGMPGLGKTTLVRKIYNDPAIEYEFFTRAWVYVSHKYSKKEVYSTILGVIMQKTTDYTHTPDEVITEELRKVLNKGKYLIVLDDVWTAKAWEDLKNVFPNNKKGSRILITSRHKEVALSANPINGTHDLKFLTDPESWELLENKVFGKGKCTQTELRKHGEIIAAKCGGLPLAIVVIAGILLNNRESSDWWEKVAGNVNTFVVKNEEQFMKVISMSYNHLPYHLKACFLYLGVFPEDYEIPVWKLIRLWIAEGFIEPDGELSLEDIAEDCLSDLINRNLLMAGKRRSNGEIRTCLVHDMLYDFCKKEAASQNFFQEIKRLDQVNPENYRRICIHSNVMNYIISKPPGEHVRSFLSFPPDEIIPLPRAHISMIPKAFELLRVLDIKSIFFEIFPKDILALALLRYLVLSCQIKALTKDISRLWSMQTLILFTTSPTLELKEEMWKMYQLRHLYTNASAMLPRPPVDNQKGKENMQSLSMISPQSCTKHVFARTPYITKLGVKGKIVLLLDDLFDNVANLQYLTNLKLYNDATTSEGKLPSLASVRKFPKKLKKLTLSNTLLDWEEMHRLGSLEKLEVLKLKDNAFKGEIWEPKVGGFVSLKVLHIGRTNLMSWKASQHHFPSLKHLVLQHCDKLVEIPYGLADINSFQVLELYCTNPKAAPSARKIQGKKMLKAVKETKPSNVFKLSVYPPDM